MMETEQQDQESPEVPQGKKEPAVLTKNSLKALSKVIANKGMVLAMYLNIPTTRLVNISIQCDEKQVSEEAQCVKMLEYWKEMRAGAKDKEKIADLGRGLKEAGFLEIAEVIDERSKDNVELTTDCFPAP